MVRVAAVESHDFPIDEIVAPGKVELNPNRVSKVLMPVAGRVRRVMVKLGDSVTERQPVALSESAEAGLALVAHAQAQAQVRQATTTLARAEKEMARARELNANKAASQKDVLNAETEFELAKSTLTQAQAEVEGAAQRLALLGLDPARHSPELTIQAPIAGKVLELSVAPGELRNDTNEALMTIADMSTVWITSQVPESAIRLVHVNEALTIELVAYPGERFHGRVRRIADTVDAETRTVKVQAELSNSDGRLRPEMFGRIRHEHGSHRIAAVPTSAIVHGGGSAWVMVERAPRRYDRRRVQTGEASDGLTPITEGLREGERVVVDGAALLRDR
jgi:cobalt-zinc-cadmium efflux system membrane fusion protein